jgi:serine/threonine-protein kinase RsbW
MTRAATPLEISLRAEPSSVRDAREAVAEAARQLGISTSVVDDIRLCVSEAVANVVRHAYVDEIGNVHIRFERLGRGVVVFVRDFGSGSATSSTTRARSSGGFGWKIIQALTDRYTVTTSSEKGTEVSMSFGTRPPTEPHR